MPIDAFFFLSAATVNKLVGLLWRFLLSGRKDALSADDVVVVVVLVVSARRRAQVQPIEEGRERPDFYL